MRKLLLLLIALAASVEAWAQVADTVSARLDYQRWIFPQEKIHVTTDKPYYTAGDTIWLRAFVVDAASHQPVHASQFVYVELRPTGGADNDSVALRIKLREQEGVFKGYLPLDEHLAEGDYTLVAYTMFMQSVDDSFFFKRSIPIVSAYATRKKIGYSMTWIEKGKNPQLRVTLSYRDAITGEDLSFNEMRYCIDNGSTYRKFNKTGDLNFTLKGKEALGRVLKVNYDGYEKLIAIPHNSDYDVTFYPEGGYLVPGSSCRLAFKAVNDVGCPVYVQGEIVDEQQRVLTSLSSVHNGMGEIVFTPSLGQQHSYTAILQDSTGVQRRFPLPTVTPEAAIVQVVCDGETTWTVKAAGMVPAGAVIVLQQRGVMVASGVDTMQVDETTFQPGVVEALLIDKNYRVLSRRLFFVRGDRKGSAILDMPLLTRDRDHVQATLSLNGFNVPEGDYAVAVTDDFSIQTDTTTNILAQLLLQSDLRGYIANPAYYFGDSVACRNHLDLLMLTQGWTRYDIPEVVKGVMAESRYPIEASQAITGRVLSEWRKRPLADIFVSVIAPKIGWADAATTNADGYFSLAIPSLPDSVQCVLQAINKKGKHEQRLLIDSEEFPFIAPLPQQSSMGNMTEDLLTTYITGERSRIVSSGDMRNIMLSEIVVLSKVKHKDAFEMLASRSYDNQFFENNGFTTIEEALRNIPGLWIANGSVRNLRIRDTNHPDGHEVPIYINNDFGSNPVNTGVAGAMAFPDSPGSVNGAKTLSNQSNNDPVSTSKSAATSIFEMGNLDEAKQMIGSFNDIIRIDYIPPGIAAFLSSESSLYGAIVITTKSGISKAKEYENMDLHFITPLGYQRPAECYNQKYENGDDGGIVPGLDMRNRLYWNPCVKVDGDGLSTFDFYVNDVPGTSYTVTIEGVTADGEIIYKRQRIGKE